MKNKGVLANCEIGYSYTILNPDLITVNIHCKDFREGVVDTEQAMAFVDDVHGFFPVNGPDYALEFNNAWKKIGGWLERVGVEQCCHGYIIDRILNCSSYQLPKNLSLLLDVHIEIFDDLRMYKLSKRQRCLLPRDDEVEETSFNNGIKRLRA